MGAQHFWNTFIHRSRSRKKQLTEITIWRYFVSDTTICVLDAFQCLQSENNHQKQVRRRIWLTLHNHCTLLIENCQFQIVMDLSQGPVNNVQAFLGMSLTDKISVMVSVRGFCLFVFYIDLITILSGNFWKFLNIFMINIPLIRIFVIWKCVT